MECATRSSKTQPPPGQVSFRFRIGAGSIQETPNQQGIAHFLEHMAFRGSTHVPDGEVFRRMERLGAALGADTNASTGWTETVYKFDLPHGDAQSIDTAMTLMRETASELLLKPEAVDSERPVILSEERVRDTPPLHVAKDQLSFVYKEQPYGDHLPIGSVDVIQKVQATDIKRFYDAYYRPERATLIVVGRCRCRCHRIGDQSAFRHMERPPGRRRRSEVRAAVAARPGIQTARRNRRALGHDDGVDRTGACGGRFASLRNR